MNKYEKAFKDITGVDFEKYYNEHKPSLIRYISNGYTKDIDKAEDFANQAFMQSLEKIETYNKDKSLFKTWLTKIAINLVIKEWKDTHKYHFISLERDTTDAPNIINLLPADNSNSLEIEEENKKKVEIVYNVIDNLPEKYKKVMIMRELNHMAYKDIADSIKKESKFELSEQKITLINPEDFFQLSIDNNGRKDINLHFESEDGKFVFKTSISPNCNLKINREDIIWDRKLNDLFTVDSTDTSCVCVYTTTTNLSTIKSQIKKGRELIQKKVKKNFENIDKNGIKKFF